MLVQMMPPGRQALVNAANGLGSPIALATYEIGTDYNFTPNLLAGGCQPQPPTFSGDYRTIYKTLVTVHEVIFTVFLPYYLAIVVGNVMIKLSDGTPFLWMIMDQKFQKYAIDQDNHYAGDTYYQSMIVRFPYICNLIDFTKIADFYASPYTADRYQDLPAAVSVESDEYIINLSRLLDVNQDRAVYGTNINGNRWALPLMKRVDDPEFGDTVRGGRAGDGYQY